MAFNQDNIVQYKTGTFNGTSGSATLDTGTTAGNAIVIVVGMLGDNATWWSLTTPATFTMVKLPDTTGVQSSTGFYIKKSASAAETTWTLAVTGGSTQVLWAAFEISGADLDWDDWRLPYISTQSSWTFGSATWSGWTNSSDTYDGFAIIACTAVSANTTAPTFTGYGQGFYPLTERQAASTPKACTLGIATKQILIEGQVGAWCSHTPDAQGSAVVIVFTGLASKHAANVTACFGAEIGTATSITSATATNGVYPVFNGVTGTPAIVTSTPRTGLYCLELASTAAAENLTWTNTAVGPDGVLGAGSVVTYWTERFHVYFPTSLPAADTPLCSAEVTTLANGVVIRYITASQKIGVKIGTGTEVVSDTTVVANQWIGIDWFYDPRTTTHSLQWQITYDATPGAVSTPVPQTTVTQTGMTAGGITTVRKGWTTAITATVRFDDIVGTRYHKTYPIGDVQIMPLKVDPAGTPTLSGTAANWRTFTSNGTVLTAWSATNTRVVLADVPPTIGASADGLTQITAAGSDFVTVPMETYTCAPDYSPLAGRWYWAGWALTTTAAQIQFMQNDGVGSFTSRIGASLDSGFDNATLVWTTVMHNPDSFVNTIYPLTQAKVDGLAAQFGWSIDATPDVGVHSVLFELVVIPAVTYGYADVEGGAFNVYIRQHPHTGAAVSYLVTTPAGTRGARFYWTIDGTPNNQYVGPNTAVEISVGASTAESVSFTSLEVDPEV
jgi:hypothetical protein